MPLSRQQLFGFAEASHRSIEICRRFRVMITVQHYGAQVIQRLAALDWVTTPIDHLLQRSHGTI